MMESGDGSGSTIISRRFDPSLVSSLTSFLSLPSAKTYTSSDWVREASGTTSRLENLRDEAAPNFQFFFSYTPRQIGVIVSEVSVGEAATLTRGLGCHIAQNDIQHWHTLKIPAKYILNHRLDIVREVEAYRIQINAHHTTPRAHLPCCIERPATRKAPKVEDLVTPIQDFKPLVHLLKLEVRPRGDSLLAGHLGPSLVWPEVLASALMVIPVETVDLVSSPFPHTTGNVAGSWACLIAALPSTKVPQG
mmetsp:Transcript_54814/g.177340  ORF Transcript_54814/g.177340 Transcript_54814/m.177340 type:complete len:249 (+) Transcript_54814:115-861(+)